MTLPQFKNWRNKVMPGRMNFMRHADLLMRSRIMVKNVKISPTESLIYTDFSVEEAGVKDILTRLGMIGG